MMVMCQLDNYSTAILHLVKVLIFSKIYLAVERFYINDLIQTHRWNLQGNRNNKQRSIITCWIIYGSVINLIELEFTSKEELLTL